MSYYSLFDKNGTKISHGDKENRSVWYKKGELKEDVFIKKIGQKLKVKKNPQKKVDPTVPDLMFNGHLADLKCRNTPMFTANRNYEYDISYTVTLNLKDILDYNRYDNNFTIIFWVDWVVRKMVMGDKTYRAESVTGVWKINLREINRYRSKWPIHWYNKREAGYVSNKNRAKKLTDFEPRLRKGNKTQAIRGKSRANAACSYIINLHQLKKMV